MKKMVAGTMNLRLARQQGLELRGRRHALPLGGIELGVSPGQLDRGRGRVCFLSHRCSDLFSNGLAGHSNCAPARCVAKPGGTGLASARSAGKICSIGGHISMSEDTKKTDDLTDEEMRGRVIQLAFGGDERRFREFCETVNAAIPQGTGVVLRGSAVTGVRWDDGAPFDADGPGTSDLDLTLVGDEVIEPLQPGRLLRSGGPLQTAQRQGPGHRAGPRPAAPKAAGWSGDRSTSRPRATSSCTSAATSLGQPYLTLIEKTEERVSLRLLSYNIRYGGVGREDRLAAVIRELAPDVVVFRRPPGRRSSSGWPQRGRDAGIWAARPGHSLGFMSRLEIAHHEWHRPPGARHPFLEIVPAGTEFRVFGLHLSAVHSNWTERRRVRELRALLDGIERASGRLPRTGRRLQHARPGRAARRAPPAGTAPAAGLAERWPDSVADDPDAARRPLRGRLPPASPGRPGLHLSDLGPAHPPRLRLSCPSPSPADSTSCEVVRGDAAAAPASDHFPLLADLEVGR